MSDSMTIGPGVRDEPDAGHDLVELGVRFDAWLDARADALAPLRGVQDDGRARIAVARRLQAQLYDGGWAQCGWPAEVGGSGGTILHRALVHERLTARGYTTFAMFEHLEILLPALLRYASAEVLAAVGPDFLSSRVAWCQGFSEPEAGSDLANLRTTARPVEGGYVISGRKIWTSWAGSAGRCLVLARTGPVAGRHRNLTMFMVDLDMPGVRVSPIRQATGDEELAEVVFDDVAVDAGRLIGAVDQGWEVALHVLMHERGTFTWFRHLILLARLRRLLAAGLADRASRSRLGELVADFVSVRAAAIDALRDAASGRGSLARVSACKLQLTAVEQCLYDLAISAFGSDVLLGVMPDGLSVATQHEYQFSRVVSIYGGSREMQLNAIAKQVLGI